MELKTYLAILNRQRIVITVTLLCALIAAVTGTFLLMPKYEAASTLRFATAISGSTEWVQYNIEYTDRLMNTYSQLATSATSTAELMQHFQMTQAPEIGVKIIANSELMQLWVTHENAQMAAQMANRLADFLISEGAQITDSNRKNAQELLLQQIASAQVEIQTTQAKLDALSGDSPTATGQRDALNRSIGAQNVSLDQLRKQLDQAQLQETLQATTISVVDVAVAPSSPSSPNLWLNIALGIVAGMLGGLGLAFLLENFDTRVRSVQQLQALSDLPLLGEIPGAKVAKGNANSEQEIDPAGYDAFRRLSVNVISRSVKRSFSTFLVTSAEQQEGRSTVVANLAWAFAESGRRVIVVDGDFNAPTIHMLFSLPNHIGLSNILQEQEWLMRQRTQSLLPGAANGSGASNRANVINRVSPLNRAPVVARMAATANGASNGAAHAYEVAAHDLLKNGDEPEIANGSDPLLEAVSDSSSEDITASLNKSLEMSISNSLQRTMIPGVQILATGPLTLNNPAQLLSTARMKALMEQLQARADIVIVDAPAFLSAAYTSTLASIVDAAIFVVGYDHVKSDVVKESLSHLRTINPDVLGIVANWANRK